MKGKMHKNYRKLISAMIFVVLTFGVMVPLYVHYTARQFPGAYDTLYLSGHSSYDTIIIEVHYHEGAEPSENSLMVLKDKVRNYTGKNVFLFKYGDIEGYEVPDVIIEDDIPIVGKRILSNHTRHRTGWFSGNMVIYIIYANANWEEKMNYKATGITYNADSIFIFKDSIGEPKVEETVLLHEIGHLWGLPHSNKTEDIMNIHLEEFLMNHIFNKLPNDFSEKEKKLISEKRDSWIIIPVKPYEPIYSVVLNHASTIGKP